MSTPADDETKLARRATHALLDELIELRRWTNGVAYLWIQRVMLLSKEQAHIGQFDIPACQKLQDFLNQELAMFQPLWSEKNLESIFGYHKPKNQETNLAHDEVRAICKDAARTFGKILPDCPEKTLAIRRLQEAMFFANSAVAQHGIPDAAPPS